MLPFSLFPASNVPEYHEGMLLVKVRPTIGAVAGALTATTATESMLRSPGLSALSHFERAGMIKRITPLAHPTDGGRPSMMALGAAAAIASTIDKSPQDPTAGVSFVELVHDAEVPNLQSALSNDPHVERVSRVPVRYLQTTAAAPPTVLWNLAKIRWPEIRQQNFKIATDIRVAILDTGVDVNHPDLKGRITQYVFTHPDLPLVSGDRDLIGHGTHVSGIIGAIIGNNLGINGICECQLLAWKIFDDQADLIVNGANAVFQYVVDPVMYRRALIDCLDQDVDVINLSIGGPRPPDFLEQDLLFTLLQAKGTTIVAAMGNERQFGSPISYPAAFPGVIAVGATSLDDSVANFSNQGNHIALSAPGVGIWSTLPTYPGQIGFEAVRGLDGKWIEGKPLKRETDYDAWDGTSMATPHVTAAVALLLSNKGKMTPTAVRNQLMQTADPVAGMNGSHWHPDYGAGRLNLLNLLS